MVVKQQPKPGVFQWVNRRVQGWLQPKAVNRDEAFRERVIRSTLAIIILLGLLSFASIIFVFRAEWTLISFPTLHIVALAICFLSAGALLRGQLFASGWLLILAILFGASGVVVLARQAGTIVGLLLAVATFMFVPLVTTLVLPRNYIFPASLLAALMYSLSQFGVDVGGLTLPGLSPNQQIISVLLLLLVEGALLRQLRVEFDARFEAMSRSIRETELAKQQEEAARQRAESADRAKSQFLANMSHELRTPLNAIIGYDEAMLAGMVGTFTPRQSELLGYIQKNSRRLLALINDVLDLSKIEAGSLEIFLAPMSVRKVISDTVNDLNSLATEKQIKLATNFSDTLPEVILGDSKKIEQVVINLIGNAIKFTETGEVTVDVTPGDSNTWQLIVRDTGIGISSDAQALIFSGTSP